ncbi:Keratinocyte-associated protein 2 [Schistosoma japonicum]|nr:Keratinocyte-associated protein 2 [Schistosoma japonicum]
MVLKSGVSSFMSLLLVLVMFAAMQLFAETLRSSQLLTIVGGFIGSLVFVLLITFVNNLERTLFGGEFCSGVFPEVITCILIACTFSATVHRVCGTTCLIFSLVMLYYLNRMSHEVYQSNEQLKINSSRKKKE